MISDKEGEALIEIPAEGKYIKILGHKIDGYSSFEEFIEELNELKNIRDKAKELEIERDYYKKMYLECNNVFIEGGRNLTK